MPRTRGVSNEIGRSKGLPFEAYGRNNREKGCKVKTGVGLMTRENKPRVYAIQSQGERCSQRKILIMKAMMKFTTSKTQTTAGDWKGVLLAPNASQLLVIGSGDRRGGMDPSAIGISGAQMTELIRSRPTSTAMRLLPVKAAVLLDRKLWRSLSTRQPDCRSGQTFIILRIRRSARCGRKYLRSSLSFGFGVLFPNSSIRSTATTNFLGLHQLLCSISINWSWSRCFSSGSLGSHCQHVKRAPVKQQ